MEIAVYRNFLFYARCGAKDFFDKLRAALSGCPQYTISGCYLPTSDTQLTRGASPLSSRPVRCADSSTPSRNMLWNR